MPLLEIRNISKIYQKGPQEVKALNGVGLNIEKGEFTAIMGPSGSGKSTLLNIVGCLDIPTSGQVIYDGQELSKASELELSDYRKDNIAFIFQSYNLIPVLTVTENIELPLVIEAKLSKDEIRKRATEAAEQVGLGEMLDRFPREISGGQEQRVAIARALVKKPLLILADEPTANLDSVVAEEIISVMKDMNEKQNTTFIFATHDPRMEVHAKRKIMLHDGQVEE